MVKNYWSQSTSFWKANWCCILLITVNTTSHRTCMVMLDFVTELLVRQSSCPLHRIVWVYREAIVYIVLCRCGLYRKNAILHEARLNPFKDSNQDMILAPMPAYIGIHPESRQFICWSEKEAPSCSFDLIVSYQVTTANQKDLYAPLIACRVELYMQLVFVREIGLFWSVSTNSPTRDHSVKISGFRALSSDGWSCDYLTFDRIENQHRLYA